MQDCKQEGGLGLIREASNPDGGLSATMPMGDKTTV